MVCISTSGSIDILLLRHVVMMWWRYGLLMLHRTQQCSKKWMVVSGSLLHRGQMSEFFTPTIGLVVNGYRCTMSCALTVTFLIASGLCNSCHTGCSELVVHASMLRYVSDDIWCASFLSLVVHTLVHGLLNSILPFQIPRAVNEHAVW